MVQCFFFLIWSIQMIYVPTKENIWAIINRAVPRARPFPRLSPLPTTHVVPTWVCSALQNAIPATVQS